MKTPPNICRVLAVVAVAAVSVLTLGNPGGLVAAATEPPHGQGTALKYLAQAQSGSGSCVQISQVGRQRDVAFGSPAGQTLLMDAYLPPQGRPPFPAVVMIHGGGFNHGDKSELGVESVWLAEHGYVAFSINYRLAPQFPFPAAIQDAQTAVSFIRKNAARFQVDPKRIAVLGTSGGGTIAVSLGARSGQGSTGSRVTAVVAWSPPLDLLNIWQSTTTATIRQSITDYLGLPGQDLNSPATQDLARQASPINMVGKSQPPTFIANSKTEMIAQPTAEAFVGKLKELGIPGELLTPPSGHAVQYACIALQPSLDFLNKYIGGSRARSAPLAGSSTAEQQASPLLSPTSGTRAPPVQSKHTAFLAAAGSVLVALVAIAMALLVSRGRRPRGGSSKKPPAIT